jgi:hypothetical protein
MNTHTAQFAPLSFSSLTAFAQSPRAFIHYKTAERLQTPAMRMGTLAHRHILEPALFNTTTVVWDGHRRGKEWTQFKDSQPPAVDILTRSEMDQLEGMKQALKDHPGAIRLLQQCNVREMPVEWTHKDIKHRGIIDALGSGFIMDLKMTNDVSERALSRVVWERRYFMQCAMYAHAANYHGYDVDECYIIAVQSAAPHHVTVCNILPHYITRGHDEWCRLLDLFHQWDGEPSHTHGDIDAVELEAPPWAPLSQSMTT